MDPIIMDVSTPFFVHYYNSIIMCAGCQISLQSAVISGQSVVSSRQ